MRHHWHAINTSEYLRAQPSGSPACSPAAGRAKIIGGTQRDKDAGLRWHAVHAQPHCESRAVFHIERQGYEVFCPRLCKTVRQARTVNHVLAPLFPGYLFLNPDVACDQWRAVNGTYGVARHRPGFRWMLLFRIFTAALCACLYLKNRV